MARPRLRRDRRRGMLGGVCAGLARHLAIDPLIVRVAFLVAAAAGGAGIVAYAFAWLAMPFGDEPPRPLPRLRPGAWQVAAGIGLLLLSALLLMREVGLWFGDVLVWPLVLLVMGVALIWRQTAEPVERPAAEPLTPDARSRVLLGAALVVGGALVFLWLADALRPARDVVLAVVVVLLAAGLILAPWWVRLVRHLQSERSERIRSQERAEVAAHLHDSVLQTLALMQRRADDPRAVATLARRQERELRAWLNGGRPPGSGESLVAALERAAAEVEDAHGAEVELVTVGDVPLDERTEALAAAAREALVNAAKFARGGPISLYAEAGEGGVHVFVRDRGPGFDPEKVPDDRRGVRDSIIGRMQRHGGRAAVHSTIGDGTEVELSL